MAKHVKPHSTREQLFIMDTIATMYESACEGHPLQDLLLDAVCPLKASLSTDSADLGEITVAFHEALKKICKPDSQTSVMYPFAEECLVATIQLIQQLRDSAQSTKEIFKIVPLLMAAALKSGRMSCEGQLLEQQFVQAYQNKLIYSRPKLLRAEYDKIKAICYQHLCNADVTLKTQVALAKHLASINEITAAFAASSEERLIDASKDFAKRVVTIKAFFCQGDPEWQRKFHKAYQSRRRASNKL